MTQSVSVALDRSTYEPSGLRHGSSENVLVEVKTVGGLYTVGTQIYTPAARGHFNLAKVWHDLHFTFQDGGTRQTTYVRTYLIAMQVRALVEIETLLGSETDMITIHLFVIVAS